MLWEIVTQLSQKKRFWAPKIRKKQNQSDEKWKNEQIWLHTQNPNDYPPWGTHNKPNIRSSRAHRVCGAARNTSLSVGGRAQPLPHNVSFGARPVGSRLGHLRIWLKFKVQSLSVRRHAWQGPPEREGRCLNRKAGAWAARWLWVCCAPPAPTAPHMCSWIHMPRTCTWNIEAEHVVSSHTHPGRLVAYLRRCLVYLRRCLSLVPTPSNPHFNILGFRAALPP